MGYQGRSPWLVSRAIGEAARLACRTSRKPNKEGNGNVRITGVNSSRQVDAFLHGFAAIRKLVVIHRSQPHMTHAEAYTPPGREICALGELPHEKDSRDRANRIGVGRDVLCNSEELYPGPEPWYWNSANGIGCRW